MTTSNSHPRLMNGAAWNDFCDDLKRLGDQILRTETPADPATRAEGFRHLTHVLRSALDIFVDHADPDFPVFYRVCDEVVKYGGDNPDNYYQKCVVRGDRSYRITGHRGTIPYLSFLTQGTTFSEGKTMLPTGFIDSRSMKFAANGTFELIASTKMHPGNWLPMQPETQALLIRQTFGDRASERIAELEIECLDRPPVPRPIDPAAFEQALRAVPRFIEGSATLFCDWAEDYQRAPNQLPIADQALCQRVGGDPNICYCNGYWELGQDEALVVELPRIPECESWNLQLCNYWMESLDYRYQTIHLNKFTAVMNPNGSVRIIVAHRDPGLPNWLSTAGHRIGTWFFRWIGAKEHIVPQVRVVKLDSLETMKGRRRTE